MGFSAQLHHLHSLIWNAVNTDKSSDANPSAFELNISIPGKPLGQSNSRTGVWNCHQNDY